MISNFGTFLGEIEKFKPFSRTVCSVVISSTIWVVLSIISYSNVGAVEYPAGVDPNSCPNYPFCSSIAATPSPIQSASHTQYSYQPQPNNFLQYQPQIYSSRQYQPQQYQPQQYQPQQYQPQQRQSQEYQPQQYQPQQHQARYYQPAHSHQEQPQAPSSVNQYTTKNTQYSADIQKALDRGEYIGDGDYHGEGLAEALAPGYQGQVQARSFDSYSSSSYDRAYNPANAAPAEPARYPAGVDPNSCPNYPFCS